MKLKNNDELEKSGIVANSLMNRERRLIGTNSYSKELSINIIEFIEKGLPIDERFNWLDICCGTGRALIEAAEYFYARNLMDKVSIVGIDLVPMFYNYSNKYKNLNLINTSIMDWDNQIEYDLITCVHGLHYIGDKLKFIQMVLNWLKPNGLFIANIDINNIKIVNNARGIRLILKQLREYQIEYNSRKHLIYCNGKNTINFLANYIGADDNAGKNYTGQPVVNSFYELIS